MQPPSPETIYNSLRDSVFFLHADGSIAHANERFEAATGLPADELRGKHVTQLDEFVEDDEFDEFYEAVDAVLTGRDGERRVEISVTSPLKESAIVEARITTFISDQTEPGAIVVLRDVTDHKRQEAALAERSEQLAIINQVLRHDVRNDIEVMIGWAEHLEEFVDSEEARTALDRVLDQGEHVVEVTREARDLVDAVEVDWEMALVPVDVGRILRREVDTARARFPTAEISLEADDRSATVMANEFLGSVFGNLLTNAVVHNDADAPEITITSERMEDAVSVRIEDNGPGIPDTQRERLFERGAKGSDSCGTGVGLYLVRSLVDAFDGTVTVDESEPGGTTVRVDLPLA